MTTSSGQRASLHAWVDESIHTQDGLYLLAAAVGDPSGLDGVRERMVGLARPSRGRLHWRDEDRGDRDKIVAALGDCDLLNFVVVGSPVDPKRQERARRKCALRLFHELQQIGVTQVWIESRTASLNERDRKMVLAFRGSQVIPRNFQVDFLKPSADPMLWVPDAVAGAVATVRRGDPTYDAPLRGIVQEFDIPI